MQCSNNLKQLQLAALNYESAYNRFPFAMGGTTGGPLVSNAGRLSGLVPMLPYLEQQPLYNTISRELAIDDVRYPPFGPAPWIEDYPPWKRHVNCFVCPSSPFRADDFAVKTYAFCIGDVASNLNAPSAIRGAFAAGINTAMRDIADGTSHTIAFAEIGLLDGRAISGTFAVNQSPAFIYHPLACRHLANNKGLYLSDVPISTVGRGGLWADGASGIGMFNTILPPNSTSCSIQDAAADGIFSAASGHHGGINVAIADGSVQFISNSIDCGDAASSPPFLAQYAKQQYPSPFGVWGALGTAAGGEGEDTLNNLNR
ncbi:MAG: hypothetical protein Aurels2KO_43840 [Aureliella sp.]